MVRNLSIIWDDNRKWIEIYNRKGFNLQYGSIPTGYRMQCNYNEENSPKEYKMVLDILESIRNNIVKLIEINEAPFETDTEGLTYE